MKGGDGSCPFLLREKSCREEAVSGNRKGCPFVTFREVERNGKIQHIITLQNCAPLHAWDKDLLRVRSWGFLLF